MVYVIAMTVLGVNPAMFRMKMNANFVPATYSPIARTPWAATTVPVFQVRHSPALHKQEAARLSNSPRNQTNPTLRVEPEPAFIPLARLKQ